MDATLEIQSELEKIMVDRLQFDAKLSDELKSQFLTDYLSAKNYFKRNIYGEIKAVEKDLTDHSERHIRDVHGAIVIHITAHVACRRRSQRQGQQQ